MSFPNERLHLVLGGPGCGKTTRLLQIVASEIEAGVSPHQIAFVAFTKAAALEAQGRAAEKFKLDPREDLPWFRTIHSLAYHSLGMTHDEVMNPKDWRSFSAIVREPMKGYYDQSEGLIPTTADTTRNIGDVMLRIVDYAATTCQTLEQAWRELDEPIDWFRLKRFADTLDKYKSEIGKVDFTDMLQQFLVHQDPIAVKVAIIDESQDLTQAQWRMVAHAFRKAERVYVGGDDDQAIYRWAGADVDHFLGLKGEHEILPISHRLPFPIFAFAQGIVRRIQHRFPKDFRPTAERSGHVEYHRSADAIDYSSGTWLLLARNGYLLPPFEQMCERLGYPYRTRAGSSVNPEHIGAIRTWEALRSGKVQSATAEEFRLLAKFLKQPKPALRETTAYGRGDFPDWPWDAIWHQAFIGIGARVRDYYVACLRRGEKLTKEPRIRIETIHGVKGAEADNVLVCSDISAKTKQSLDRASDHEHRVFYVGVTRARKTLHILEPQTMTSYPL